jgi:outer membrane protein assembly factor BamE (lipoprotein component of BamABCDE complex)
MQRARSSGRRGQLRRALLASASLATLLGGCGATITKHGHQFAETDVQQIQPGMSQEQVRMSLGSPTTTATVGGGNAFYYISSTTRQTAFFKPDEVDRRVLAVYFNQVGTVERVADYGLKDGKVFDFVKRETPSSLGDKGLIAQFFRGVGPKQTLPGMQ